MNTSTLAVGSSAGGITTEEKKVLTATLVGTAIEWYDYFIYAQAAGLVLGPLFFAPIAKNNPALAQILSFATIGISFLFRPLGAIICGHLGDKLGRKVVLVMTLILMGASTVLIGVLPTYQQIGLWAPVLLIVLRIIQGFSAGGEWGGAALMAVEHAPVDRRSFFGSFPQIGVPIGFIIATLVLLALTAAFGKEAFADWAWRLPFLFSIVLIIAGSIIRRTVEEFPVFEEMHKRRKESSAPLGELFRSHTKQILLTTLIFVGNNAAGYLLIAFFISYGQQSLHLPPAQLLFVCTLAAGAWLAFTLVGGFLGDKIGRVRTFQVGYIALALWAVPMFLLIDSKNILFFFIAAARFDDTARSDLRTTSRVVCGDVSSEGTLFWSVGRVRAWLDTGRSVRGDDSAVDRLDVWPVLAHRRLLSDPLGNFADCRFGRQRPNGCRSE